MTILRSMRLACGAGALAALACIMPPVAGAVPSAYYVPVGESRVYRLDRPVKRVAVGDPEVADYIMINSSELYLTGKKPGATNLILWEQGGASISASLQVSRNTGSIMGLLSSVLPKEKDIRVFASGPAVVLSGSVSDALAAQTALGLVKAYFGGSVPEGTPESLLLDKSAAASKGGGSSIAGIAGGGSSGMAAASASSGTAGVPRVVNLLKVRDAQQVRLEVRIAEVSRSYIESLGLKGSLLRGDTQGSLMTGFVSNSTLNLLLDNDPTPGGALDVEAERKKGWIKILAEPTLVAMSGTEGYFLVGGKVYTPTVSTNGAVDYVERTYGVGLRCVPTVLDSGRISLNIAPEVSEPLKEAVTAGTNMALPSFKLSYASTTVQMNEGQNLVIGGLLRDNLTEVIRAIPLLGDIPILGALFRRTEMNSETTELMVVVRPTLVKASDEMPELPTDRFVPPSPEELFLEGKLQGSRRSE